MNANLLKILTKIIASHGENILSDPLRLKAVFSDLAKNEHKEDRVAFGRCIEMGFYNEFKRTQTEDERRSLKMTLANQLQAKTGIDKPHCNDALDLLEAAVFNSQQQAVSTAIIGKSKSISVKTLMFGVSGAVGVFVGEWLWEKLYITETGTSIRNIIDMSVWAAFLSLGISVGLLVAQSVYLKKIPVLKTLVKSAFIGILLGAASSGFAQFIFNYTQHISDIVSDISRVICWGIMGCGVGCAVSIFVPNFPKNRAMAAGFLGGLIGGVINNVMGSILGVMALGFFIGLTIYFIEEALREAWLTVIWGPKETRTIALGQKPIVFGSSREADIYLSKELPVRATVQIENSRIVMNDKITNQRRELKNGDRVDLGKISFVVNTKK
jgi:hypothetical protein